MPPLYLETDQTLAADYPNVTLLVLMLWPLVLT
jgi:hypothetical protein